MKAGRLYSSITAASLPMQGDQQSQAPAILMSFLSLDAKEALLYVALVGYFVTVMKQVTKGAFKIPSHVILLGIPTILLLIRLPNPPENIG